MKRIIIIYIMCVASILTAQQDISTADSSLVVGSSLIAHARYFGDSVVLRWAPELPSAWQKANLFGYQVSRADVNDDSLIYNLLADTIKPRPLESWLAYQQRYPEKEYSAIAMQCVHGKTDEEIPLNLGTYKLKRDLLANRHGFTLFASDIDMQAANNAGLRYVDYSAEKGKKYIYRVSHLVPESYLNMSSSIQYIDTDSIYQPPAIALQKDEQENVVTLLWDREKYKEEYTAYFIERSKDNVTFTPLNEAPYIQPYDKERVFYNSMYTYTDSIGSNYEPYYYRVSGVSMFGNRCEWSAPLMAQGVDRTPPPSITEVYAESKDGEDAHLIWTNNHEEGEVERINVHYSFDQEESYFNLTPLGLGGEVESYTHVGINKYLRHFYRVETIDTAGNSSFSVPYRMLIRDSIPPEKPTGLAGVIDTNGIVSLSWNINIDLDLMGYKVFFANDPDHEFSLITGHAVQDTTYRDSITLKTFTRKAYYKIMAVDQSYNYSEHSEILELVRPDIVPPSSPIINDYEVRENGIFIGWARSESDDLARHEVHRRVEGESWELVVNYYDDTNSHLDTLMLPHSYYDYKVVAVDSAGLVSPVVRPIRLRSRNSKVPAVQNFSISLDKEINQAQLSWDHPMKSAIKFVIYKQIAEGGYNILKVNAPDKKLLYDADIQEGRDYNYAIKVMHDDGRKSKFSEVVNLKN